MKIPNFDPHSDNPAMVQRGRQAIGAASFAQVGPINPASSTPIANSAAAAAFDVSYTIPRGLLENRGVARLYAGGVLGTNAGAQLTIRVKIGGVTVATLGPIALADGLVNSAWTANVMISCRQAGSAGSVLVHASGVFGGIAGSGGTAAPVAVDTTQDVLVELAAQWNTANAANTITLQTLVPEHL